MFKFKEAKMFIEVFKTNVTERGHADMIVAQIKKTFNGYIANFDLDDCDNILRVKHDGQIHVSLLIELLRDYGFTAEVLQDFDTPPAKFESLRFIYN